MVEAVGPSLPACAPRDAAAFVQPNAPQPPTSFADVLDDVRALSRSVDDAKTSFAEHQRLASSLLEELQRARFAP